MKIKTIQSLQIHVTHSCNLTCESCSHYSNQGHTGVLSLDEANHWMKLWSPRISPQVFTLLGGEPTIHPNLTEFISLSKKNWPDAKLILQTNGFFLHRHPNLSRVLRNSNCRIHLSIHHNSPEYVMRLKPILALLDQWREDGIDVFYENALDRWTRRYHGYGSTMKPFRDNNPRRSWEICPAKECPQLFEGKIWKCAALAYLKLQDAKYKLSPEWDPYLKYKPLDPNCTEEDLETFFDKEEESYCSMCSANLEKFEPPLPFQDNSKRAEKN